MAHTCSCQPNIAKRVRAKRALAHHARHNYLHETGIWKQRSITPLMPVCNVVSKRGGAPLMLMTMLHPPIISVTLSKVHRVPHTDIIVDTLAPERAHSCSVQACTRALERQPRVNNTKHTQPMYALARYCNMVLVATHELSTNTLVGTCPPTIRVHTTTHQRRLARTTTDDATVCASAHSTHTRMVVCITRCNHPYTIYH